MCQKYICLGKGCPAFRNGKGLTRSEVVVLDHTSGLYTYTPSTSSSQDQEKAIWDPIGKSWSKLFKLTNSEVFLFLLPCLTFHMKAQTKILD